MMGERTVAQETLFYEFSLDRHVPAGRLLHSINRFVDLAGIGAYLRPFYSETGRPSIDPELMIPMRRVSWASWDPGERVWRVPFRSLEPLRERWLGIEIAAQKLAAHQLEAIEEAARNVALVPKH